jgi:hypothetical protein
VVGDFGVIAGDRFLSADGELNLSVMAGLRPGHPRHSSVRKDVDARHKAGHDER